jgi:hypothetical protein
MGSRRNAYKNFVRKPGSKRPFGTLNRREQDNIKTDLK